MKQFPTCAYSAVILQPQPKVLSFIRIRTAKGFRKREKEAEIKDKEEKKRKRIEKERKDAGSNENKKKRKVGKKLKNGKRENRKE